MPEITEAQMLELGKYQSLGTYYEVAKKISDLETDNRNQREAIRGLKETQPKDGQVIVSKEDADLLPKYKELGTPKDLKAQFEAGAAAQREVATRNKMESAVAYVSAAGLAAEAAHALVAIPALSEAVFEVEKSTTKDEKTGKDITAEAPVLVLTDDKGNKERLSFAAAAERFPAMKGLKTAEPVKPGTATPRFIQQSPGDKGGASETLYEKIRREAKEKHDAEAARLKDTKSVDERLGHARPQ